MGKKTPAPPPAPDPVKVAAAQTDSNIATARMNANMNRLDETDPMGSVKYTDLGGDHWRKDTSLSPIGQEQFDLQNQVDAGTNRLALQGVGQASNVLGTPFSLGGLPQERAPGLIGWGDVQRTVNGGGPIQRSLADGGPIRSDFGDAGPLQRSVGPNDFSADRAKVEQAVMSRMQPQIDQGRAAMAQRLADQGIPAGSEAYKREMATLGQQENDARMQAILAGGQEQSRMFGMDLNKGNFVNDAQRTAYEQEQGRAGFSNDAQALRFNQGTTQGNFANDAQGQEFNQGVTKGNFTNQSTAQMIDQQSADKADWANARQRQLQELLLQRSQPINEIGALLGTGQVGMPQFQQTTPVNVQGTDVIGAYGNKTASDQAAANQAQSGANARSSSTNSALGTAATAAAIFF